MKRRPSKWTFVSAVVMGLAVAGAWIHSHMVGWSRAWSKPGNLTAGRVVSVDGRFFVQSCHVNPDNLDGVSDRGPPKLEMPADFQVGTNRQGDKTVIPIGDFHIPFAEPPAAEFVGVRSEMQYKYSPNHTFWRTSVSEFVVRYWLVALIPLGMILIQTYRWFRWRSEERVKAD